MNHLGFCACSTAVSIRARASSSAPFCSASARAEARTALSWAIRMRLAVLIEGPALTSFQSALQSICRRRRPYTHNRRRFERPTIPKPPGQFVAPFRGERTAAFFTFKRSGIFAHQNSLASRSTYICRASAVAVGFTSTRNAP